MKLIIRLLILTIAVYGVLNFNLKALNQEKIKIKEDFTPQWVSLFTTLNKPLQMCIAPDQFRKNEDTTSTTTDKDDGVEILTPMPKHNKYAKEFGFGPVAYLFDYWDFLLQADVSNYFINMFNAAKAIAAPAPNIYEEPYSLDKMLYYYSQGTKGSLTGVSGQPAEVIKQISQYNKNFNPTTWQNSVTVGQMYQILSTWGWKGAFANNPPKKLVDRYDFDGDGRLNPTEFILLAINNNREIFRLPECKQYCFEELFKAKIDPIFRFMDCDQDGYISSENMWNVLSLLKRPNVAQYNMYNCIMPSVLNKGYRTISDNDFILKNSRKFDGFVDITEFRAGVLLGYWDRQTDSNSIFKDDFKNMKSFRWSPDGTKDLVCQSILALMPGGAPVLPAPVQTHEPINILVVNNNNQTQGQPNSPNLQPMSPVQQPVQQPFQNPKNPDSGKFKPPVKRYKKF
jgi:Ca2+-binding EF-hand superfamily protein